VVLFVGSGALAAYTVLFIVVANQAVCLDAIPGPLHYLPQRALAIALILVGVWSVVHASRTLRSGSSRALAAAYETLGVILFLGAAVRFAYVGFFTGWAMCGYLP
jgi:hypothetical protein